MITGRTFRINPTARQRQILLQWIGHQRYIYNAKTREDLHSRQAFYLYGVSLPITQKYSHLITPETPWLRDVPSQILRNGATRWKQAYDRFFSGLGNRPTIHSNRGKQSVWITEELFSFRYDEKTHKKELWLGTKKFPIGFIPVNDHREFFPPKSLHISVQNGKWSLSFSFDDGSELLNEKETLNQLKKLAEQELLSSTVGFDRGVVIPVMASTGKQVCIEPVCLDRIKAKEVRRKRYQRRLQRQAKGSKNRRKTIDKISKTYTYSKNVRKDTAHKGSCFFATDAKTKLFVVEKLKIQNMVSKPKPKKDDNGKFLPNGAKAKAVLNKAIMGSFWGLFVSFLRYKAAKNGKLLVEVEPHFSSQECSACEYIHADNRRSQDLFVCQRCGYTDNADHNASLVIAKRGARLVLSSDEIFPSGKRTMKRVRGGIPQSVCGEAIKTLSVKNSMRASTKQKTPAVRPEAPTTASA